MGPKAPAYEMIETDRALARACERLAGARAIAVDTEFARERTFTPRLGLVQVSDGTTHALIDPLPIGSLGPLFEVLARTDILKILHAPREDLEIFFRLTGRVPRPVFDTQLAAGFLGQGYPESYQSLVREVVGEELDKLATRTDWLRRPLTRQQREYAVLDVVHLHPLHDALRARLREAGREAWLEEELRGLERLSFQEDSLDYYRRVRRAWKLTPRQLGILRLLCAWREDEAFERDCPRGNVVPDDALVDLARLQPRHPNEIRGLKRIHPREVARSGRILVEKIREGRALPEGELPEPIEPPLMDPALLARADFLSSAVRIRALELGMSPELLGRRRSLEELVKAHACGEPDPFPEAFSGWRREAVGSFLLRVLEGRVAFRLRAGCDEAPLEAMDLDLDLDLDLERDRDAGGGA